MSIIEVAKSAGVSKATVSRVINNVGNVSPDTVRIVHQAMEELNYQPKQSRRESMSPGRLARRLPRTGLSTVTLALPEVKVGLYAPLQHGFTETMDPSQFQVAVRSNGNEVYRQFDAIGQALYGESAGIALLPVSSGDTPSYHVLLAQKAGIPVVLLHRGVQGVNAPTFVLPLEKVGRHAATMALEHYHQRVAVFMPGGDSSVLAFTKGIRERLAEAGYDMPDSMFFTHGGHTVAVSSEEEAKLDASLTQLSEMSPDERPTAIITSNNHLAEIIWLKLLERGLRVPEDVSIIAFGSKGNMGGVRSQFALVAFDAEMVGREAARVLNEMMCHERDIDSDENFEIELTLNYGRTLAAFGERGE